MIFPIPFTFNQSSINHIKPILKNQNKRIYVSDLVIKEKVVHHFRLRKREIRIMIPIIRRNKPPHIVGVPALCLWRFENIGELSPVTDASRICCPAFKFFKIRMYKGYKIIAKKNAPSENRIIWLSLSNISKNKK